MCKGRVSGAFVGVCLLSSGSAFATGFDWRLDGIAALGDSYVEEYRFQPPDKSAAKNFVEILAEYRGLNFGTYAEDLTRGEPRLAGYEFNYGRDTARSSDLLAQGQHTGVAALANAGRVELGVMFIGGNTFRDVFIAPDPVAALQAVVPQTLTDVGTAVQTMLAAHPDMKVVVANVPDLRHIPEVKGAVAAGLVPQQFVDAVSQTIRIYNGQLKLMADAEPRLALVDAYGLLEGIMDGSRPGASFPLDTQVPSHDPGHLWVDTIHAGTAGHILLANEYIGAINSEFGGTIELVVVPEPSSAGVALVSAAALCGRRRRVRSVA